MSTDNSKAVSEERQMTVIRRVVVYHITQAPDLQLENIIAEFNVLF